jgi:putative flippase GtrA
MLIRQITIYGIVGLNGFFINLSIFSFCKFILRFGPNTSSILAFLIAVIANYSLNRRWTFNSPGHQRIRFNEGLIKYFFANLLGLGITLSVLNAGIYFFGDQHSLYAQVIGVMFGMVSNFIFSKFMIFRR